MFRLDSDAQPGLEDRRRWMARAPSSGEILYFDAFDTLHRWIVEREVDRSWEISRTGDKWTGLGEIGEFRPIFQVVDNVSTLESGEAPAQADGGALEERTSQDTLDQFKAQEDADPAGDDEQTQVTSGNPAHRRERRSSSQPSAAGRRESSSPHRASAQTGETQRSRQPSSGPQRSPSGEHRQRTPSPGPAAGAEPGAEEQSANVQFESGRFGSATSDTGAGAEVESDEWTFGDEAGFDETTAIHDDGEVDYYGGRRSWPWVVGLLVALLAGSGAYLWFFQRDRLDRWLAMAGEGAPEAPTEIDGASEDVSEGPPEVLPASRSGLAEALGAAREVARDEVLALVGTAVEEARPTIAEARSAAGERADAEADQPEERSLMSILRDANNALEEGRASRARKLYGRAVDRDPGNSEAITGLGWARLNLGNPDRAIEQFQRALEVNPSYGDAYIGLGQASTDAGNLEQALDAYESYLEQFPDGSKASIAEYQKKELEKEIGVD